VDSPAEDIAEILNHDSSFLEVMDFGLKLDVMSLET